MNKMLFFIFIIMINYSFVSLSNDLDKYNISENDKNLIKKSRILLEEVNKAWIPNKKYESDITASFYIHLKTDGTLINYHMFNIHCPLDSNDECEIFVDNIRKTIKKLFPIKKLNTLHIDCRKNLILSFGTKESNEILIKKQQTKIINY